MKHMISPGPLPFRPRWQWHSEGDCLVWDGAKDRKGYPRVGVGRADQGLIGLHVWVCLELHGPRPSPQHMVLHSCANPSCFFEGHLRWGTAKENSGDMVNAGNSTLKTVCQRGHLRDSSNVDKWGACISCKRVQPSVLRRKRVH